MHVVRYLYEGRTFTEESPDSPEAIRRRCIEDGKIVLGIRRKISFGGIPKEEVATFLTSMGDQASSGVHTTQALDNIVESLGGKSSLPSVVKKIRESVANGASMSSAMSSYPHIFGHYVLAMIEAGEQSGEAGEAFLTAAEFVTNQSEINQNLWQDLSKPLLTLAFGIFSLLLNSSFALPTIMKVPMIANARKDSHDFISIGLVVLQSMKYTIPCALILCAVGAIAGYLAYKHRQEQFEKRVLKLPGVREVIFYRAYFVAFSSLAKLIEVGVPLGDAFEIVEKSTGSITLKQQFSAARAAIGEGQHFTHGLSALTAVERSILHTAPDASRLHRSFRKAANRYHRLYLKKVKSMGPKIQAVVMILVGAIFLLEVLGIVLPYTKMLTSIH